MAYQIFRFDKTLLTLVDDGAVDTTAADIIFIGRNFARYGEIINENFMFLLENFSSGNPPPRPLSGQLWYNSNTESLNYYTGEEWKTASGNYVSSQKPLTAGVGDFWWDVSQNQLYVYNGTDFVLIGPQSGGADETQHKTIRINDSVGTSRSVIAGIANGQVVYIVSALEFVINQVQPQSTPSLSGFSTIRRGINMRGDLLDSEFKLWGTAYNSDNLGGVPAFSYLRRGSSNVLEEDTIKVDNINKLSAGNEYIEFDTSIRLAGELRAQGITSSSDINFSLNNTKTWSFDANQDHSILSLNKGLYSIFFDSNDRTIKSSGGVKIHPSLLDDTLPIKITDISNFTSDNLQEGTINRYFTNTRARQAISVNPQSGLRYNSETGELGLDGDILGPQLNISLSAFSSDNLNEGSKNRYFTPARARSAISVDSNSRLTYDQSSGVIGLPAQFSDSIVNHGFTTWLDAISTTPGAPSPKILADVISALSCPLPPGTVIHVAQNNAPPGFLVADGRAVSRTQFAALFAAIGTTYGAGNGSSTFNLPDLRNEFIRGSGPGREVGSTQTDSFRSHTHTATTNTAGNHSHSGTTNISGAHAHDYDAPRNSNNTRSGSFGSRSPKTGADRKTTTTAGNHNHTFTTNSSGGHSHTVNVQNTGGDETRPRNIALLACIKT